MTVCKTDSSWEAFVHHRELSPALCDDLEGWGGRWGEREPHEGGDIRILIADSHCCTAETNNIGEQFSNLENNKKKKRKISFNTGIIT